MEDESCPTGVKIIPVPELERRQKDLVKVSPDHGLLPTALHCLKDRPRDRPTAAQLCQSLGQLKITETYTASVAEDQQRRLEHQLLLKEEEKEEKEAEIARLQEQMRQLTTEKEREVEELRRKLQTSQRAPVQRERAPDKKTTVSKPQASGSHFTHFKHVFSKLKQGCRLCKKVQELHFT